ncbi:MAG: DUF4349 domain-containing protein [Marmoricola sp.]
MTTSTKKTLLAALVVPAIALTAACTSGGNEDKSVSATSAQRDAGGANAPAAAKPAPPVEQSGDGLQSLSNLSARSDYDSVTASNTAKSAEESGGALTQTPDQNPAAPASQAIISKGQVSLHSKDIDKARFDLQKLLDGLDGTIADEQSNADKAGKTIRQRLVLRVPSKNFGKAMDGISGLDGTKLVSRSRSSQDVTTDVIDNAARVRTQRASLARVQALLARATSLREVISIESQLSRRQADLDSLEAQQKYLADQTSLSTINVYLTVPSKKAATHPKGDDHNFFSGLKSGWDHLGSSTNAVLTGTGAVLPFAALGALIGFPTWAAWRRRKVAVAEA